MRKYRVAGIGEILWDILPDQEVLGGAPVNFAYHTTALGAHGIPISTVGEDARGKKALTTLQEKDIDITAISVNQQNPSGFVEVFIDSAGNASYHFPDNVAWDNLIINKVARNLQKELDAVCFGTLAQRSTISHHVIQSYLSGLGRNTLKIYDVNFRQNYYSQEIVEESLAHADIAKLSDEELPILANLLYYKPEEKSFLKRLVKNFSLKMVILTRGREGSLLMTPNELSDEPGSTIQIADTIGAGDAFTAAVTIGFLEQLPLSDIHTWAARLAEYVCTQHGAMPHVPDYLSMIAR